MAGLQLAAISLEKLADVSKHQFVTDLSGDDRYILDYLLDEVLRQQPEYIQTFIWSLAKTEILPSVRALRAKPLPEKNIKNASVQ